MIMRIAVDFDDTIVLTDKPYDQIDGKFRFVPGAVQALQQLKAAGHILLLWSARASLHHRRDWRLNPLAKKPPRSTDAAMVVHYRTNQARFDEMVAFVNRELDGIFDAIDEGTGGKPTVDIFIDDRALKLGPGGLSWGEVANQYGAPHVAPTRTKI